LCSACVASIVESCIIEISAKTGLCSTSTAGLNMKVIDEFEEFNSRKFSIVIVGSSSESDFIDNAYEFSKESVVKIPEVLNKLSKEKILNYPEADGGCCTQIVLMGAARPYIGQVTCQGEGVPPTEAGFLCSC
jgi:hypothetical protein